MKTGSRWFALSEAESWNIYGMTKLVLLMVMVAVVFALNELTPLSGEDYWFSLPYALGEASFSEKVILVGEKIHLHFTTWNARIGDHIAIAFLAFDKTFFNIANTGVFLVFITVIRKLGDVMGSKQENARLAPVVVATVFALTVLFCPVFGYTTFWLVGATNYLWSITVALLFFYRYWRLLWQEPAKEGPFAVLGVAMLGLVAGLSNENTVPALLLSIGGLLWYLKRHGKAFYKLLWVRTGLVSFLIGYLILVFAPSTRIRYLFFKEGLHFPDPSLSLYWEQARTVYQTGCDALGSLTGGVMLLAGVLFLLLKLNRIDNRRMEGLFLIGALYIVSYLSGFILILSPYIMERAFFFLFVVSILFIVALGRKLSEYKPAKRVIGLALMVLVLAAAENLAEMIEQYSAYKQEVEQREQHILQAVANGSKKVVVHSFKAQEARILTRADDWLTVESFAIAGKHRYAQYYGLDYIEIEPYEGKSRFFANHKITDKIMANFDGIRQTQEACYFFGWAVLAGAKPGTDQAVYVVLRHPDGRCWAFDTVTKQRIDVAAYFAKSDWKNCGFETMIRKRDISPGTYELWIGMQKSGNTDSLTIQQYPQTITIQ